MKILDKTRDAWYNLRATVTAGSAFERRCCPVFEFLTSFDFSELYDFVYDVVLLALLLRGGGKLKDLKKKNSRPRSKGRRL